MNPQQALALLYEAAQGAMLPAKAHEQIGRAAQVLQDAVQPQDEKPREEKTKETKGK